VRVYFDSSALVKRAVGEPESPALLDAIDRYAADGVGLSTSTLASIELHRAVRLRLDGESPFEVVRLIEFALSGLLEYPITEQVASIASRLGPFSLRGLDAIHLATATLVDADLVCAYDQRLLLAASELGFRTISPGRD
jgi:predicted nucleic acid-binding protein